MLSPSQSFELKDANNYKGLQNDALAQFGKSVKNQRETSSRQEQTRANKFQ